MFCNNITNTRSTVGSLYLPMLHGFTTPVLDKQIN